MALLGNEGSSLGALVPIKSDKTVAIGGQSGVETPPKRKVLHEDKYIEVGSQKIRGCSLLLFVGL